MIVTSGLVQAASLWMVQVLKRELRLDAVDNSIVILDAWFDTYAFQVRRSLIAPEVRLNLGPEALDQSFFIFSLLIAPTAS